MSDLSPILAAIRRAGLVPRGAFHPAEAERIEALANIRTIVLIGVAGRMGWDAFAASAEARDGGDHPLDRFSRRVIDALARELGAIASAQPPGYQGSGPPIGLGRGLEGCGWSFAGDNRTVILITALRDAICLMVDEREELACSTSKPTAVTPL